MSSAFWDTPRRFFLAPILFLLHFGFLAIEWLTRDTTFWMDSFFIFLALTLLTFPLWLLVSISHLALFKSIKSGKSTWLILMIISASALAINHGRFLFRIPNAAWERPADYWLHNWLPNALLFTTVVTEFTLIAVMSMQVYINGIKTKKKREEELLLY